MRPAKSSAPEIGVIGSINRDTIHRADGSTVTSWGGILYNLKYMSENVPATIVPAVNIGRDCRAAILRILRGFPGLDMTHIHAVDAPNNHCFLHYADQAHKCEMLVGGVPPLTFTQVAPLAASCLILVNFISGRDITLPALEKLRGLYNGPIYMDIHSLTLGRRHVTGGVRRFLRRPRFWRRYAACADILQVNRTEFELLAETRFSSESAMRFFRRLQPRTSCLIITLGKDGCFLVGRDRRIWSRHIPGNEVMDPYDTTGCGDIFAAGFIAEYIVSHDSIRAAENGNRLAAARCRLKGRMF